MNLTTTLPGVMPVRPARPAVHGDARPPNGAGDGDATDPPGGFARALSEAVAIGRTPKGAAGDKDGPSPEAPQARGKHALRDAADAVANAGPTTPGSRAPAAPSASLALAVAPQAQQKGRASSPVSETTTPLPADEPAAELDTPTDAVTAKVADAVMPGGGADALTLPAEWHAKPALPAQPDPMVPHRDEAADGTLPLLERARSLPAAITDQRPVSEPANAIATPQTAPTEDMQPETPVQASAGEPTAVTAPVIALAPPSGPPIAVVQTPVSSTPVSEARMSAPPGSAEFASQLSTFVRDGVQPARLHLSPQEMGPIAVVQTPVSSTPVSEARMSAPPGSAAFASQLGSQLSTFVRDGVQHARLHLSPQEMGPVTVQIRIDGQTAQVHMAAEHFLTRQALEQSMPLLASSLREAGLTLSGGGVFEQPRQSRDEAPPGSAAGSQPAADRGDDAAFDPGVTVTQRRGVVDLVA